MSYYWNDFVDGIIYDKDKFKDDDVLILIVGRSGSGKTTLEKNVVDFLDFKTVKSYTTRPPRYDGEDSHIFVSKEEFDALEEKMGYTKFNGYEYCATKEQLNNANIYVIDPKGVRYLWSHYNDKKIFIMYLNADRETCFERMIERGEDRQRVIERLKNDDKEFYDFERYADAVLDANDEPEYVAQDFIYNYTLMRLNDRIEYLESEVAKWKDSSLKLP